MLVVLDHRMMDRALGLFNLSQFEAVIRDQMVGPRP
jgi:hypothetical protein